MHTRDKGEPSLSRILGPFLRGALAGLAATVPMTIAMELMHRLLPARQRYPLPPERITVKVADETSQEELVDQESERTLATAAGHFGYGAAGGSAYAFTFHKLPLPLLVKGPVYGLALWALSYLGWLPALGILTPATEHPPRRVTLMIVAHLIYGAGTALVLGYTSRQDFLW